jgi:hypothetical protein
VRWLALPALLLVAASCRSGTDACREVTQTVYVGVDDTGAHVDQLSAFLSAHPGADCQETGTMGHLAIYTCHACD